MTRALMIGAAAAAVTAVAGCAQPYPQQAYGGPQSRAGKRSGYEQPGGYRY